MSSGRRDLSALTSGRAGALTGKLGPRRTGDQPTPADPPAPVVDDTPPPDPAPVTEPKKRKPKKTAPDPLSWQKRSWPAYMPRPVLEQVRADLGDRTLGEWLLDAYEAVNEQLPDRFTVRPSSAGLPPRTARPRRNVGGAQEVQLRLTGAEIDVLEARMTELGNPSRSAFVTAVAELALGGR